MTVIKSKPSVRLAVVLAIVLIAECSEGVFAQRLKGKVADGTYSSPRGLLSVPVPKATNWAGVPFAIQEDTETGERNFDTVVFYVKDFGEVLLASVRRIPPTALENMAKDDPQNVLKNLANKALTDWRQNLTEDPVIVEDDVVATAYGQAALRVYRVRRGSLLQQAPLGSRKRPESVDALVAVIAAKRNDHMVSAIAEDDGAMVRIDQLRGQLPSDVTSRQEVEERGRLKARLQQFFGGLVVPEAPVFDKK